MSPNNLPFEKRCPVDVLYLIVSEYADRNSIHALYATCRYISVVTASVLFRRLAIVYRYGNEEEEELNPIQSHDRTRFVRSLLFAIDPRLCGVEVLAKCIPVIQSMHNLQKLKLWFSYSDGETEIRICHTILENLARHAPFKLISFASDISLPPYNFLLSQPSIRHLSLPTAAHNMSCENLFTPQHLPSLSSIDGSSLLIQWLACGRPIRDASINVSMSRTQIIAFLHAVSHYQQLAIERLSIRVSKVTRGPFPVALRTVRFLRASQAVSPRPHVWSSYLRWFPCVEHILLIVPYLDWNDYAGFDLVEGLPVGQGISLRRVVLVVSGGAYSGWYDFVRGPGNEAVWEYVERGDDPYKYPRFSVGYRDSVMVDGEDVFSV